MSRRAVSVAVRALVFVFGTLVLGAALALAGSFVSGGTAHAAVASSCSPGSGGAETVTLGDGVSTLVVSGGNLEVSDGAPSSCGTASSITSLAFAVGTGANPTQVIFDQTGGVFPCFPLSGSLGTVPLQVTAVTGASPVLFGTSGVSLAGCASADSLSGVSGYTVVLSGTGSSTGPITVSAAGGSGTGSATTATLNAPANTSGTAYTLGSNVTLQPSGAGSYTIALTGNGDSVSALTGTSSFTFSGAHPIGFSGVSGGTYTLTGLASSSQVTGGTGTESFTFSGGGGALTFAGASGGVYTLSGLPASSQISGGSGTESFTLTSPGGPLILTGTSGGTYTVNGLPNSSQVTAGAGTESFTINGSSITGDTLTSGSGNTTFVLPGTGNSGNTLLGGSGTGSFTLSGDNNTYRGATGTDTVTITGNSNDFIVGSGSETFYDTGSSNTVDFGAVGASPAAPLFVNDSGSSQSAGVSTIASGQATLSGSAVVYTFRDSSTAATSADFTVIRGASGGSTDFLAGGTGGITFIGQGVANAASFFGSNGIVANVSGALQISNAQLSQSATPLSGFQIGSGQVLVGSPGASTSCSGTPIAPFCDVLTDVFNITGPTSGYSTFYAGGTISSGDTYKFSDAGDFNTFIGGTGPATFSSAGNHNTFVAGFGNETFTETTTSQVPSNTIDFSNVPTGQLTGCTSGPCTLTVNVSGAGATVPNFVAELLNSALTPLATYTFGGSGGGADFTNFIGAAGGNTTFLGGSGNYAYTGKGTGNTLDFSNLSGISSLTFDVTHSPLPQVQVGAIPESFSGITTLVGLAGGSTTFIGGSTGGYTFEGKGTGNQAIFTTQGPSTTLSVTITQSGNPVSGGTVTFSIAGGSVLCSAVPVSSLGVASCYPTSLPSGQVQIVAVYTPPTGVTFTGSGVVLSVSNGSGPTATTTAVDTTTLTGPLFEGQPVTLQAIITSTGPPVTSGSVAFFLAGSNAVLCSYTLPATSCSTSSLPAGNYVLVAVYTPGSGFSGSAGTASISVNSPPASTVSVSYAGGSSFNVTYSVPGGSTGNLCISSLDPFLSGSNCQAVSGSGTITGLVLFVSNNDQVIAELTYASGPTPFSGSSSVIGPLSTTDVFGFQPTGTSISASVNGVAVSTTTAGTTVNFTITVTAPGNTVPSGGSLTVEIVGGAQICTVPVPGGGTSATLFCSANLPAGQDNILAIYSPPCCMFTGAAAVIVVTVNGPTSGTLTTGSTPTQDLAAGVVANLSSANYCTNGSNPCVGGISVPGGDVLVAAPQSGITSCSGTPIQTFCDSLVDISVVTGSAGGHNTFVAGNTSETVADTGSVGGDTIDFSNVATGSSSSLLTVNVSGGSGSFTASVASGGPTFIFTTGGAGFTNFVGSSQGFTDFLAGPSGGYSFTAKGAAGNTVDFSAAGTGLVVNLSGSDQNPLSSPLNTFVLHNGQVLVGTPASSAITSCALSLTAICDSLSNVTTLIGSSQGLSTFYGGAAPSYTFTGIGTGNHFFAGAGSDTFLDSSGGNTVDFSLLPNTDSVVVNVSGQLVSPTPNNSATSSAGSTYTFGGAPTTFVGSPGGTTFYAGTVADTFNGNATPTTPNVLNFSQILAPPGALTICVVNGPGCTGGSQAQLGSTVEPFSHITQFNGLTSGNTTFVAGSGGGLHFVATGSGNTVDFSQASNAVIANLSGATYAPTGSVSVGADQVLVGATTGNCSTTPSLCDTLSTAITTVIGYASGGNTFVAGPSSETFASGGTGNAIDFSRVPTGSSSSILTVNVTGGSGSFTASVAAGPTYTFTSGGSGFTNFTGSSQGFTTFLAGPNPGYTFVANGSGNVIDFSAATTGVVVNLSSAIQSGLAPGRVTVGVGTDTISGLSNVIGSAAGGNTFYGGSGSLYTFTAPGNANVLVAGTGSVNFIDNGTGNVVDFSQLVGLSVVVDRSSTSVSPTSPNNATASNGANYSFGSAATTFDGAPGGTTFYAGSPTDIFNGFAGATNRLIFQFAPQTSLTVCVVSFGSCVAGQAQVSGVRQVSFTNIGAFTGLAGGNTTFVAGDNGGFTFTGLGSGNTADFSAAVNPIIANLAAPTNTVAVAIGSPDTISGITTIFGSECGGNTFVAGSASEVFGDIGTSPCGVPPRVGDKIDFSALTGTTSTSPLTINASGKQEGLSPFTATFGSNTWTFSTGGTNFTTFIGAGSGNTLFLASGTATGFSFFGNGSNNTLNLATNTCGLTVDMTTLTVTLAAVAPCAGGSDNFTDIATVIGSPTGANTFYGGLTGTTFTAQSSNNTLSYLHETGGAVTIDLTTGTVTGPGTQDLFSFPNGTLVIQGSPANDTLIASSRAVTIQGGGGADALNLSHLASGVMANLNTGSITGSGIGGITFTPCTASPTNTQLCLASITGTPGNDTFVASSHSLDTGATQIDIVGGGGTDTLDLSKIAQSATISMVGGSVIGNSTSVTGIVFSAIADVIGTHLGGDYVYAAPGTATFIEPTGTGTTPGTMDFSQMVTTPVGVNVNVATTSGTPTGTAGNSLSTVNYTFSGFTTFVGTPYSDTFTQTGTGTFNFYGLAGNNTLALNSLPSNVTVTLTPGGSCDPGNSDGSAFLSLQVNVHFYCMYQVTAGNSLIFVVTPGETTSLNGGGNGTLELAGSPTGGATINLATGQVSGGGYSFSFSGMSTIDGTALNDLFIAGPGTLTLNGGGGNDTVTFAAAPSAVVINDSGSSYTVPAGYSNAGTVVPAHTAVGGYGGTITLTGIFNLVGSNRNNDILVADPTSYGALTGGGGNDRFVLTGGDNYLYGGTGISTLDLSLLPSASALDLASSGLQSLGTGDGYLTLGGGNIQTVVASPNGSQIWGGTGTLTIVGGPGSDWLAAGTGTQTLVGGGGSDTLVGGVGTDTLQGGTSPVTFVPGQGSDTLTGATTGNTLDYSSAPAAVDVNLSSSLFSVPAGEPFAGATLAPQTATGGWGATVNLGNAGIGFVVGTSQADIFVTGAGGDNVTGNGGPDLFIIESGNNTLTAGPSSGARFLFDGAGNNLINGGGNATVDFSQAPAGVTVNLQTGNATGGWGGFQQLSGVLNIVGSNFNDVLVAGAPGGTIIGLNGNDLLQAGPSGGDTLIGGGNGNDTFCAQSSCAVAGTIAGGGDTMIGGSGNDVFFAQNGVPDTIDGGGGFNTAFTDPTESSVANIQQQTIS